MNLEECCQSVASMAKDQKAVMETVNHPAHYTQGGIECIDAIRASMTLEEFQGYLKGNAMKYQWRFKNKGKPLEDLQKANWYLTKLIDTVRDSNLNSIS